MNALSGWATFCEIIGSAGGALIGIQFVVIALIGNLRRSADADSINAFGTPTIMHFGSAMTIAAVMSAPWPAMTGPAITLGLCGLFGFSYSCTVFRRARRSTYEPVFEDWLWYAILPCGVYAALAVAGVTLRSHTAVSLFVIAAAALCLLLIGVHNAWDSVTHLVVHGIPGDDKHPDKASTNEGSPH